MMAGKPRQCCWVLSLGCCLVLRVAVLLRQILACTAVWVGCWQQRQSGHDPAAFNFHWLVPLVALNSPAQLCLLLAQCATSKL